MAAISNSSSSSVAAVKSPRHGGVGSPQSRRAVNRSPWNQIVRGESEPIATVPSSPSAASASPAVAAVMEPVILVASVPATAAADSSCSSLASSPPPSASSSPSLVEEPAGGESSEGGGSGPNGGNVGKRPAWNKPSNGGAVAEVGPVMGAVSWPALSESTRASSAKSSSSESLKGLSDGLPSVPPVSQGSGTTVSTSTPSQKHAHPTSTPNHAVPARQKPMRRNNSNVSSNGGVPQQQAPAGQAVEIASNNPSPKDHSQRSGFGSHSHGSSDHPQQRNSFRRNGGPHPRGDGSHHHNYGGRRDQDRGSHDWNSHRSFYGRDSHIQQPRVAQRMFRGPTPPPSPTPLFPPHLRPYGAPPMGFQDLGHPVVYVAHPPQFVAPPLSPVFFYAPDPELPLQLRNQIDYYFSNENLIKDTFLRGKMDDQGWVDIDVIASFKKVAEMTEKHRDYTFQVAEKTKNTQLILDSIRVSNVVEVQGNKVRRRNDWKRWLMPPQVQYNPVPSPRTPGKSSPDMLAARVQAVALEDWKTNISSSSQGSYEAQLPNGDAADHSFSGRN